MTALTLPRLPSSSRPSTGPAIRRFFANLFAGIREGRDIQVRYDRLVRLTDGELAQLGLTRFDIPRATVEGVKGL